jgi:hypothetical protein
MNTTKTRNHTRNLLIAAAAGTFALGAASSVSASTEPPPDASAAPDVPVPTAGEAASPEAAAFCEAYLGVEAAGSSEDPAAIEPAIGAAMEAAPADAAPLLEALVTAFQTSGPEGPEFEAAYGPLLEWLEANCGYAQLNLTASEYAIGGLPTELSAGTYMVSYANIGEEVHEFLVLRFNDDATLTAEELIALPQEEAEQHITFAGAAFAFPDDVGHAIVNLEPGRYVAVCFLPEGATPEVFQEMMMEGESGSSEPPADASAPPSEEQGPPSHASHGMVQEFTVS